MYPSLLWLFLSEDGEGRGRRRNYVISREMQNQARLDQISLSLKPKHISLFPAVQPPKNGIEEDDTLLHSEVKVSLSVSQNKFRFKEY